MSTTPLASQGERIESGVIEEADDLYVSVGSEKLLFPWDRGCRLLEQRGQLNLQKYKKFVLLIRSQQWWFSLRLPPPPSDFVR